MHATDVIAYTFDADYYCVACTEELHPGATDWRAEGFDPSDYTDSEENEIHPVFGSDEWWEPNESRTQTLHCTRCGGLIDELETELDTASSASRQHYISGGDA